MYIQDERVNQQPSQAIQLRLTGSCNARHNRLRNQGALRNVSMSSFGTGNTINMLSRNRCTNHCHNAILFPHSLLFFSCTHITYHFIAILRFYFLVAIIFCNSTAFNGQFPSNATMFVLAVCVCVFLLKSFLLNK